MTAEPLLPGFCARFPVLFAMPGGTAAAGALRSAHPEVTATSHGDLPRGFTLHPDYRFVSRWRHREWKAASRWMRRCVGRSVGIRHFTCGRNLLPTYREFSGEKTAIQLKSAARPWTGRLGLPRHDNGDPARNPRPRHGPR